MNAETRTALVESLYAELDTAYGLRWNVDSMGVVMTLMPIIDRALAEHNIDAMLNAVHPRARVLHLSQVEVEQWYVEIGWTTSDYSSIPAVYTNHEVVGYGPTRTEAIADACKRALEGRGDE